MDQLAIRVKSSSLEKNIEVLEIIHDKYNTYQKVKKGENKNIKLNNVYIEIDKKNENLTFALENLENKTISYGVIKSPSNNENYLATANKYPNTTVCELKEKKEIIEIENIYYNKIDEMKPYLYAVISVLGNEDNLNYNVKVEINDKNEGDNDDNTVLIVFIALVSAIVLGFIILAIYLAVIKKRSLDSMKDEKVDKLYSRNTETEIDP